MLGIFALVFLFPGEASALSSYWKNYFSIEERKAVQKNAEKYTISQIESKSEKWKGIIRGYNIKNGSISDDDIEEDGITTNKIRGLGDYINEKISDSSTPQDFSADNLTGTYAALDGSQITDINPTNITGSGNLNIGNGDLFVDDTSGNVGIGTTSPQTTFDVAGSQLLNGTLNNIFLKHKHKIYAMGDSLTFSGIYETHLSSLLGESWSVVNRGISGDRASGMLSRFTTEIINSGDAEYVIILAGINDISASISATDIESSLQAMYTSAHNAGIKVIAVTITPFKTNTMWTTDKQDVADNVNYWILNTAINVDYKINAYASLEDPANADTLLPAYDSGDHLHLSNDGYNLLGTIIYNGSIFATNSTYNNSTLSLSGLNIFLNQNLRSSDAPKFSGINVDNGTVYASGDVNHYVGIGTTSPVAKLSVIGSDSSSLKFAANISGATGTGLVVTNEGKVGIGTITPGTMLDISVPGNTNNNALRITDSDNSKFWIISPRAAGTTGYFGLWDGVGSAWRWIIDNNGNVGIGTATPTAKLHIRGMTSAFPSASGATQTGLVSRFQSSNSSAILDIGSNSGSGAWLQSTYVSDLSQKYPLLLNPNGGNIGIGTTTPVAALDVNGQVKIQKSSAQPFACDATHDGTIALTSGYRTCVCKGGSTTWVFTTDGTTSCTW